MVVAPPLGDRVELGRRWTRFIDATADLVGTKLPRELPDEPVLAFLFAGDDAVMMVDCEGGGSRSWSARAARGYRLSLRLFGCLSRERPPTSAGAVEAFVRRNVPVAGLSTAAGD